MTPFFKQHNFKQTTISLISVRFDFQVIIYLEIMMIYLGGTLFLRGVYKYQGDVNVRCMDKYQDFEHLT
jgi:hypothetical protein